MLKKLAKHQTIFFFLGLFFLTLFLYHNNLNAFFVSDDFDWITVSKERNPLTFFTTNYFGKIGGGSYGPMVNLVFYLTHKIGGLNPLPYHLVSIGFHFGNIVLIFLLTKYFFGKKSAFLASLLFTVYFNNSEAVAWIAVIPHLGATFFFLLSIYLWLKFFTENKKIFILSSLFCFLISLMFKEISISLPLILIILLYAKNPTNKQNPVIANLPAGKAGSGFSWQAIPQTVKNYHAWLAKFAPFKSPTKHRDKLILCSYFLILIIYLSLRFYTTHLSTGYYGSKEFNFNFIFYLQNFISYIVTLFSSGEARSIIRIFAINHLWLFTSLFILILWLINFKTKNLRHHLAGLLILLASISVYLPLLMNPLNNEGERYLYLPSTIFIIILSYFIASWLNKYQTITTVFLIIFIFSSSIILYQKNQTWFLSSTISKKIITDISKYNQNNSPKKLIFLSLPDNLSGTQIFRNAIKEAVNLFYPANNLELKVKQVYTILDQKNWNKKNLNWGKRVDGLIAKTTANKKIITGLDRQEDEEIIFELWGYDYKYFITDTISVQFKESLTKELVDKKVILLYFDKGSLQEYFYTRF